ncbi:hypothetical protein C8J56DRAFT_1040431 [Mycena floridula]|nr:hypothetical protein C8J56DRAFT_1040431 [Mycena floridula]
MTRFMRSSRSILLFSSGIWHPAADSDSSTAQTDSAIVCLDQAAATTVQNLISSQDLTPFLWRAMHVVGENKSDERHIIRAVDSSRPRASENLVQICLDEEAGSYWYQAFAVHCS